MEPELDGLSREELVERCRKASSDLEACKASRAKLAKALVSWMNQSASLSLTSCGSWLDRGVIRSFLVVLWLLQ